MRHPVQRPYRRGPGDQEGRVSLGRGPGAVLGLPVLWRITHQRKIKWITHLVCWSFLNNDEIFVRSKLVSLLFTSITVCAHGFTLLVVGQGCPEIQGPDRWLQPGQPRSGWINLQEHQEDQAAHQVQLVDDRLRCCTRKLQW